MWVWLMCCVYLRIPYLSWFTDRPLTVRTYIIVHCVLHVQMGRGTNCLLSCVWHHPYSSISGEQVEHMHSITVTAIVMATLPQWLIHALSAFSHFRLQNCLYICKCIFWQFPRFGNIYTKKICYFTTRQTVKINSVGAIGFNMHCQLSKVLQAVIK